MIITDSYIEVKDIADVFSPGEEDRAMLRSNLSASSGPSGVSTPAIILSNPPDGLKAINLGGEAEGEGASPLLGSASLDTCKHLGICDLREHKEHVNWTKDKEKIVEGKKRIAAVLESAGRGKEATSVLGCGQQFRVNKAQCCGDTIAFPVSCNHKLCPVCMRRRSAGLSKRVRDSLSKMSRPKHIVLTVKNVKHIDKAYFSWLRKCFTKLRHRKLFNGVCGGVYTIETTYNSEAKTWHVHLHILADVSWIPQKELSSAWESITGSLVVYITAVGYHEGQTPEKAVKEIAKYIVKPDDFLDDPLLVDEYLAAVENMRLFQAFGDLLGAGSEKEGFKWPDCWCGGNRWHYAGNFVLEDIYKDEAGFYRCRRGRTRSP